MLRPLLRARQHVRRAVEVVEVVQKPQSLHRERVRRRGDAAAPHGGCVDRLVLMRLRMLELRGVSRGSDQGDALPRGEDQVGVEAVVGVGAWVEEEVGGRAAVGG